MNRGVVIVIIIVALAIVLAEAPLALGRLLVYALVIAGAIYGLSLLAGNMREKAPPPAPRPSPVVNEEAKRWQRRRDEIAGLPIDEARSRALAGLGNGSVWLCGDGDPPSERDVKQMPTSIADLLATYKELSAKIGDARIGGPEIERFVWPGPDVLGFGESGGHKGVTYLKIGVDFDGNPIVVKPDQDTVFVVHRPESNPAKWWSADYPSLFHWMLMQEA